MQISVILKNEVSRYVTLIIFFVVKILLFYTLYVILFFMLLYINPKYLFEIWF